MATGPEHYAEAEKCLNRADDYPYGDDRENAAFQGALAHALLANAAATAIAEDGRMPGKDFNAWYDVAGVDRPAAEGASLTLWWLDDGHENPGAPELYFTQGAALAAGVKQFRDDNFDRQDAQLTWTLFEEENGEGSLELVADGRCTGIIARPVQPKDAA